MAKSRKLSATCMLVELIESGIDADKRKQQEFFNLAERFREESDPAEVERLGDQLGRMVFGRQCQKSLAGSISRLPFGSV